MFISSFFVFLFGDFDIAFKILICLMIIDYFTGVMHAYYFKTVSSKIGFKGIIKKVATLSLVVLSSLMDQLIGNGFIIRSLVLFYLISNEGISIVENISLMGVPVPEIIKKALQKLTEGKKDGKL